MSLVSLSKIEKYYGYYHALRDVSLEIAEGEFFSLLGPSGCGKTTLLRTIAGFETLSSGRVMIAGRDMAGVPPNKRPTNMVFQSYAIFPHLSVAENVGFGLRKAALGKAEKAAKVAHALEMVGLHGYGDRAAHALSGGQRQRVALARALILEPKVLLLDEPLSALDRKMREEMQGQLRQLQREVGITFVLVTHDQEEALTMSDRIAVMFDGQIAQLDAPQAVYERPATRKVAEFIGMMSFLDGDVCGGEIDVAGLGRAPFSAPDGQVVVGLRPESFAILPDGADAAHVAEGIVVDRAYYGDMTAYTVALSGTDARISVTEKNLSARAVFDPGAKIRLSWDPQAMITFPA